MTDLKSKGAIYLKAILFVVIGVTSTALLLAQNFTVETAILLGLVIWSFCRAYYFAFYVIEHYVDGQFRFAGLFDFTRYLLTRGRALAGRPTVFHRKSREETRRCDCIGGSEQQ